MNEENIIRRTRNVGDRYVAISEYINQNCDEVKRCKEIEMMGWAA